MAHCCHRKKIDHTFWVALACLLSVFTEGRLCVGCGDSAVGQFLEPGGQVVSPRATFCCVSSRMSFSQEARQCSGILDVDCREI